MSILVIANVADKFLPALGGIELGFADPSCFLTMIRKTEFTQPRRNGPEIDRRILRGEPKSRCRPSSDGGRPMVNSVVRVPLPFEVRVRTRGFVPVGLPFHDSRRSTAGDFQICEDAMVPMTIVGIDENSKEQEHVANAHRLAAKMALCCANLTKPAEVIREHGIVVAQSIPAYPAVRCPFNQIPELEIGVGRVRSPGCWNGQRYRLAVNNRRGATARRTIETLAAENNSHNRPIANSGKAWVIPCPLFLRPVEQIAELA